MGIVTIELPEDVEQALRREASRKGLSLSVYLARLAQAELPRIARARKLNELFGSWERDVAEPTDRDLLPLDEPDL